MFKLAVEVDPQSKAEIERFQRELEDIQPRTTTTLGVAAGSAPGVGSVANPMRALASANGNGIGDREIQRRLAIAEQLRMRENAAQQRADERLYRDFDKQVAAVDRAAQEQGTARQSEQTAFTLSILTHQDREECERHARERQAQKEQDRRTSLAIQEQVRRLRPRREEGSRQSPLPKNSCFPV